MLDSDQEESGASDGAPHRIPIADALDLHAFAPRDILDVVRDYLDEAVARGFREVRLIHGKGIGFQRDRVRRLLETHPSVEAFHDAPAERGHWGATIVQLRPRRDPGSPGQDPPSTGSFALC